MVGIKTLFWRWWYRHHQSPSKYSKDEALAFARAKGLEEEVLMCFKYGFNPDEALKEWDIYPTEDNDSGSID